MQLKPPGFPPSEVAPLKSLAFAECLWGSFGFLMVKQSRSMLGRDGHHNQFPNDQSPETYMATHTRALLRPPGIPPVLVRLKQ